MLVKYIFYFLKSTLKLQSLNILVSLILKNKNTLVVVVVEMSLLKFF